MTNRNLISLLFSLCLVACATSDRVVKLYEASDFDGGPFDAFTVDDADDLGHGRVPSLFHVLFSV